MFSLVNRDEWPGACAIDNFPAKVFLGDIPRAISIGRDRLADLAKNPNYNEASTKMLKYSIEYLERIHG